MCGSYIRSKDHRTAVAVLAFATMLAIVSAPLPWAVVHPSSFTEQVDVKIPGVFGTAISLGIVPVDIEVSATSSLVTANYCECLVQFLVHV
jgi:hypothetical protein